MTKNSVLAIGIDPAFADFAAFPQLTPEMIRGYIDAQIERLRALGYEAESCLIDLGDAAEAVAAAALQSKRFDCVVIGAGLREPPPRLMLFEKIINLVHRLAPHASICFNTTPADTAEAVLRWVRPEPRSNGNNPVRMLVRAEAAVPAPAHCVATDKGRRHAALRRVGFELRQACDVRMEAVLPGPAKAAARQSIQISRMPFRLAWPFLPTMMWSCTEMPSGFAMSTIAFVIWMSACDGVGSPEEWLCSRSCKRPKMLKSLEETLPRACARSCDRGR